MLKILSWNMNQQQDYWRTLLQSDADVALVQEAKEPPSELLDSVIFDPNPLPKPGEHWRAIAAGISDRVTFKPIPTQEIGGRDPDALMISRAGTLSAAEVQVKETGEKVIVVSLYSMWSNPLKRTGSSWIYADASAHRLISDLSALIGQQTNHRIIAAGDLNVLFGYGEGRSDYWRKRHETVFQRMEALGLRFIGPQAPDGIQASPWPTELPADSMNVPTYRTNKTDSATGTRQLDFVFASESIADRVKAVALNGPDWGPSDHCRVLITYK